MKILFLHGWNSVPGGVKPTFLAQHGHTVINPKLPDEDFAAALAIAQAEFDQHQPDVIVGSSRGGAVAMNLNAGDRPLVLLCPAWKKYGSAKTVKANTTILHSRADDVVPFADSKELIRNSGLPVDALVEVGSDHRLADPESLGKMLAACEEVGSRPTFGNRLDSVDYKERRAAYGVIFGAYDSVAVVRGPSGRYWLPGGGSLPGESDAETLTREVCEELARGVHVNDRIGEATQFFYAADVDWHYRMVAVFFLAELAEELNTEAERELCWLPIPQLSAAFFHKCHRWAVDQALLQRSPLG